MTSACLDPGFSTAAVSAILAPASQVASFCRVEAALAEASAAAGLITPETAARIAEVCAAGVEDPDAVLAEGWDTGTPVLPLLQRLRARLDEEAAAALHRGATTQDVVDTAAMLLTGATLDVLVADCRTILHLLITKARDHRDQPTTAWTFLQPATPTTVGRRVAAWLAPLVGHRADLRRTRATLPVQLGGPSGGLDDLGDAGVEVHDGLATILGLRAPAAPWHTDRSPVVMVAAALGGLARTIATIGTDLALLARDGTATMRAGGSSSMPDKRNPIDAIRAVAAAEACGGFAASLLRGRPHELERGVGGWHAEWVLLPLMLHTAAAAVEAIAGALGSLELGADLQRGPVAPAAAAFVDRVVAIAEEELHA